MSYLKYRDFDFAQNSGLRLIPTVSKVQDCVECEKGRLDGDLQESQPPKSSKLRKIKPDNAHARKCDQ